MSVGQWLAESRHRIRSNGLTGVVHSAWPVTHVALGFADRFFPDGEPIYEFDWDLLVIVDACRLDLMREVAEEYEWIEEIDSVRSLNSMTKAWMRETFTDRRQAEMSETAYVCGNPFSADELDADSFANLVEVWEHAWTEPGTVPPEAITDETIRVMREDNHERVIAHYMQPHCPFLSKPDLTRGKDLEKFGAQDWRDVWAKLQNRDLRKAEVWEGYRENLHLGLTEVQRLLRNVDAERVVVTSDHGNAIGERTIYGHPPNMPLACLREVPWIVTEASNTRDEEVEDWLSDSDAIDREQQLSALGYA